MVLSSRLKRTNFFFDLRDTILKKIKNIFFYELVLWVRTSNLEIITQSMRNVAGSRIYLQMYVCLEKVSMYRISHQSNSLFIKVFCLPRYLLWSNKKRKWMVSSMYQLTFVWFLLLKRCLELQLFLLELEVCLIPQHVNHKHKFDLLHQQWV